MIQAVEVFAVYLLLSAASLVAFWFFQIRFGKTDDLDPNNVLVKLFSRKSSATKLQKQGEHITEDPPKPEEREKGLSPQQQGAWDFSIGLGWKSPKNLRFPREEILTSERERYLFLLYDEVITNVMEVLDLKESKEQLARKRFAQEVGEMVRILASEALQCKIEIEPREGKLTVHIPGESRIAREEIPEKPSLDLFLAQRPRDTVGH